jgi:UDP-glucose 4-epimerase
MSTSKQILVLGGAGYIGSHTIDLLERSGYSIIVLDNLYSGHKKSLSKNIQFEKNDISKNNLSDISDKYGEISGIIHFASFIEVGESMKDPYKYISNNIDRSTDVMEFMKNRGIRNIVFSSSAAVYGKDYKDKLKESYIKKPINVYGYTKSVVEDLLSFYDEIYGIKSISLRYFNASGASHFKNIGEDHPNETHLIPLIIKTALGLREKIMIYGDDYNTPDGTCIRDYIHVDDLAQAHLLSLEHLINGGDSDVFNLGGSRGYSVKEIIETTQNITNLHVNKEITQRREGDPDILIADYSKIQKKLKWEPKYEVDDIIQTAFNWHKNNPDGFN